ncbi:MAG: hypothetical protein WBV93_08745 [Anaerobacillus sp.]
MLRILFAVLVAFSGMSLTSTGASAKVDSVVTPNAIPAPPVGGYETEVYYISNNELYGGGATSGAISYILERRAPVALAGKIAGYAGAAAAIAAGINQFGGGNDGFRVTVKYKWQLHRDNFYETPEYAYVPYDWSVSTY